LAGYASARRGPRRRADAGGLRRELASGPLLHGPDYFPLVPRPGDAAAQFVKSGFHDGAELTRLSYLMSIASARRSIKLAHSYFAPDSLMIETLLEARARGVKIEVIVPKRSDNPLIGKAARPRWRKLLEAGVEFWEYEPTLFHCKIMIVDGVWSIVGSVNFDERSMRLSDEANLNVMDSGLAARLAAAFEDDKENSRRLTIEDLKKQNFFSRLTDHFFGLFRSQL
jgi:cardiolipin synthase A/B